ncbi:GDT1-like protein 1, chloroplastic [Morella rubra]|uniref:GDT1-like protein 1, chloroplastic n=1 Tax=Morella rubra TaxID=262757 RepID=A0A6A1WFH8_9ROSI|nr:GDT1-like protein 1, chloroplastic [Morella rubra]
MIVLEKYCLSTVESEILNSSDAVLVLSIDHKFGETDLPIDDIATVFLLVYFGVSTLLDATLSDSPKAKDEQKETELAVSKFSGNGAGIVSAGNTIISTFFLVVVSKWGDKSFFSTIAKRNFTIYSVVVAEQNELWTKGIAEKIKETEEEKPRN